MAIQVKHRVENKVTARVADVPFLFFVKSHAENRCAKLGDDFDVVTIVSLDEGVTWMRDWQLTGPGGESILKAHGYHKGALTGALKTANAQG